MDNTELITDKSSGSIETITPEMLDPVPNYDYGRSQEKLDANKQVRNIPVPDSIVLDYYFADISFSVPDNTPTTLNLSATDSSNIDMQGTNQCIVQQDGIYQISANITWNSNDTTGIRELDILINGNYRFVTSDNAKSTGWSYSNLGGAVKLVAGDTIELKGYQDSGSSIGDNGTSNFFQVVRVS